MLGTCQCELHVAAAAEVWIGHASAQLWFHLACHLLVVGYLAVLLPLLVSVLHAQVLLHLAGALSVYILLGWELILESHHWLAHPALFWAASGAVGWMWAHLAHPGHLKPCWVVSFLAAIAAMRCWREEAAFGAQDPALVCHLHVNPAWAAEPCQGRSCSFLLVC